MHGKISAYFDEGRAEGLACEDPGARTPIGMSGNYITISVTLYIGLALH